MAVQSKATKEALKEQKRIFVDIEESLKSEVKEVGDRIEALRDGCAESRAKCRIAEREAREADDKAINADCSAKTAHTSLEDIRKAIETGVAMVYPEAVLDRPTDVYDYEKRISIKGEDQVLRLLRRLYKLTFS